MGRTGRRDQLGAKPSKKDIAVSTPTLAVLRLHLPTGSDMNANLLIPHLLFALAALSLAACGGAAAQTVEHVRSAVSPLPSEETLEDLANREALDSDSPLAPAPEGVFRFVVVSDLNGRYGATEYDETVLRAVDRIIELDPDLVLSAGDMVAGQKAGLPYNEMWEAFHDAVTIPLEHWDIKFAVAPGNHDASAYEEFAGERDHYEAAWSERKPDVTYVDDEFYPFRYAFVERNVFFVALDITTSSKMGKEQRDWLDKVLTLGEAYETKVVFGHVPLHPFAAGHERATLNDDALEALLNKHGVDLMVTGHHQAYYPGRRGELRLVGAGCLGGGVRNLVGSEAPSYRTLVVVDVDELGIRSVEALTGTEYDQVVNRASLPESLNSDESRKMVRDDLGEPEYLLARQEAEARGLVKVASLDPVLGALMSKDEAASRLEDLEEDVASSLPRSLLQDGMGLVAANDEGVDDSDDDEAASFDLDDDVVAVEDEADNFDDAEEVSFDVEEEGVAVEEPVAVAVEEPVAVAALLEAAPEAPAVGSEKMKVDSKKTKADREKAKAEAALNQATADLEELDAMLRTRTLQRAPEPGLFSKN